MTVGRKIRELRQAKDWSLAELAKRSGIALSSLSRIETGRMTGTLESHVAIARALGIRLAELYASLEPAGPPAEIHPAGAAGDRVVAAKGGTFTLLASSPSQKKMLPTLLTLPAKKSTRAEKGAAGSEKFLHLLRGEMEVKLGQERYRLKEGDSLYFQGFLAHSYANPGPATAVGLLVTSPALL